jgi:prophage antirepressor-like protein
VKDNEPWWALKDVCDVLELNNPTVVAERLDEDEKDILKTKLGLGMDDVPNRGLVIVNESGLYGVILRSNKLEAKKFCKWVISEGGRYREHWKRVRLFRVPLA